jgi:hypothetical protein
MWNPAQTWAFIVGLLEWKHADIYSPFPKEERRDVQLVDVLLARGVPKQQIRYLQDRKATTAAINTSLQELLAAAPATATLIVYYCGHGGMDDAGDVFFASYDANADTNPGWPVAALPDTIEQQFRGAQAILLADCCHSGRLIDAVAAHTRRVAYASLCSSLASELSTGNWTFTEAIISALRGEAYTDRDGDATITLAELAEHIRDEMAFAEEQVATFAVSRGFDPNLVLASAHPRQHPQIGRNVAVFADKQWWPAQIITVRGKQFQVRYYGYTSAHNQWVEQDAVRTLGRPRYPIGSTVEVKWKNRWCLATVIDERAGVHAISYEGYGPEWNEWVASKRIRSLL